MGESMTIHPYSQTLHQPLRRPLPTKDLPRVLTTTHRSFIAIRKISTGTHSGHGIKERVHVIVIKYFDEDLQSR